MKKLYSIYLLSLFALLWFTAITTHAATRYVNVNNTNPGNGTSWTVAYTDLATAITAATSGDEIWVAAGTYQPASGQSFAMKEGVKIYGGFVGTESSLAQRNWKTNITILKGSGSRVITNVNNGLTGAAILDGFTIRDGSFTGSKASDGFTNNTPAGAGLGGGIYNENVSPTFNNCIFTNNIITGGAGGSFSSAASAAGYGGAIYNLNGSPTISNSYFVGNKAKGGSAEYSSSAAYGGALYNKDADTKIFNCVFYNNNAEGGVNSSYSPTPHSPVAAYGGAIANENGAPNLVNLTVYKNTSGIYNSGANVTISNSAVWDNGGAQIQNNGGSPVITYNLVKDGFAGTGNIDAYPMFVNPDDPDGADNIWGTADDGLRLQNGSPAVDAGRQNLLINGTTTDILGNSRLQAVNVDLGAYEGAIAARGTIYVNASATGTNDGSSWENAYTNFGTALIAAVNADQVWVAAGTYQPVNGQSFVMREGVKIYGGFVGTESSLAQRNWKTNATILKGNGSRVINNTNNGLTVATVLDGFTIRDGSFTGQSAIEDHGLGGGRAASTGLGGGVYNENVSPTFNNCIFTNNTTTGGAGDILFSDASAAGYGGAIYNLNGSPTISNSYFVGNKAKGGSAEYSSSAAYGGALYNKDADTKIFNCVFYNNNAEGGVNSSYSPTPHSPVAAYGGAIANENGAPNLVNLTVYKNTSGIYNSGANVTISNSAVWDNGGAQIQNNGGSPVITYNLVKDGFAGTGNIDAYPMFVNPDDPDGADNIWGTADDGLRLQNGSPAVDAGRQNLLINGTTTDILGNSRLQAVNVDLGAYEGAIAARGTIYVNASATGTNDGSSWENAYTNFGTALIAAVNADQVWVAAGTYQPVNGQSFVMREGVKIYGGFVGTESSLAQRNWKTNATILKGNGSRVINNTNNGLTVATVLDGFTIRDGSFTGQSAIEDHGLGGGRAASTGLGGGVYNENVSPTFNNCIFTNNTTTGGAGDLNSGSAGGYGGAIYNLNGSPTISNSYFTDNSAKGGSSYSSGSSAYGGAIYNRDATTKIFNCIFYNNNAQVGQGGFGSSSAVHYGGAIANENGAPVLINLTIYKNSTGVYNSGSNINISNSIIFDNGGAEINNNGGGTPVITYNLIKGGFAGTGNVDADPKFIDANDPDGADDIWGTADDGLSLKSNSGAMNAGSNALYTGLDAETKDIKDNPRVYDYTNGGVIDMGAYEHQGVAVIADATGTVFVKKGSTGKGISWTDALGELADALKGAKTNTDIKQIWVAAGSYKPMYSPEDGVNFGTDQGISNSFLMVKDVKVYGGFAGTETVLSQRNFNTNVSTLSGDLGVSGRSYNVVISSGAIGSATLDGFTIRDGNASSSSHIYVNGNQVYRCSGAGIYNSVSDADYKNLMIMNNSCGESGGGMFSYRSSVKLNHVTMKNNSARHGGAMANQANSNATVINSLFFNNSSSEGGDAIYNVDGSLPKFVNITVAENSGNAMLNENNANPEVYNSIVWGGISGSYQGRNAIIQHSADATNGNIDATNLNYTDIFTDPANNEFSLKNGSPAINKGNNTYYTGLSATTTDLSGNPRVYNFANNGTIDLGAYEYQGTLSQTISFAALDPKNTNSADFTLTATATSGLSVSYTSSNIAIADVYEDNGVWKVKIKAAGAVDITAKQAGNGNYAAATDVVQNLTIADAVLPVELTTYTAKILNQTTRLDWSVSSERDNRKFVVYRSGDDRQFTQVGELASLGNTSTNRNYFFIDKQPLNGNNYYKLVQVDLDGKPTELGVRLVSFSLSTFNVLLYPNPTRDKVTVSFEVAKYNSLVLSAVDGKVLRSIQLSPQQDKLELDLSAYPIGTYFIRLTGAKESVVKKVVKQ